MKCRTSAQQRLLHFTDCHGQLFREPSANCGVGDSRKPQISRKDIDKRVVAMLELVQLKGFERRRIWEMSGGQQQRVALARALINEPSVLLLDEPLAALDRKLRGDMQIELQNLQRNVGITFVLVAHDQEEALSMTGFLLSFTFSFDDFIIAFFVAGSETTLPIYVFSSIRRGVTPEINAIGSMVLGVSLTLLVLTQFLLHAREQQLRT